SADASARGHLPAQRPQAAGCLRRREALICGKGTSGCEVGEDNIKEKGMGKHFDLNVLGLILASQAAVKLFDSAGGSIINISSLVSTKGFPDAAVYSGTKGAVDAITRYLAIEIGSHGIRVNAINHGRVYM